jgi:hypothetical protein
MSNIKGIVFESWKTFLTKLHLIDRHTIYFEGGLGSQILSFIEFQEKTKNSDKPVPVNRDYFLGVSSDYTNEAGLSMWSWKLNHYGIDQSIFEQENFYKKLFKKYLLTRSNSISEVFYNFRETKKHQYENSFPINKIAISTYLESIVGSKNVEYCVVHIRRGDYLNVASKVITVDELTRLIQKIKHLLPRIILISSDSYLTLVEKEKLAEYLPGFTYKYIEPSESPFLVHDLMRTSKVLIASNSTFSFSAGLLANDDCLVFFPTKYFGEGLRSDSRAFAFRQPFEYLIN